MDRPVGVRGAQARDRRCPAGTSSARRRSGAASADRASCGLLSCWQREGQDSEGRPHATCRHSRPSPRGRASTIAWRDGPDALPGLRDGEPGRTPVLHGLRARALARLPGLRREERAGRGLLRRLRGAARSAGRSRPRPAPGPGARDAGTGLRSDRRSRAPRPEGVRRAAPRQPRARRGGAAPRHDPLLRREGLHRDGRGPRSGGCPRDHERGVRAPHRPRLPSRGNAGPAPRRRDPRLLRRADRARG